MNRRHLITGALAWGCMPWAVAQSPVPSPAVPDLQQYLRTLQSFRAQFSQAVYDENWRLIEGGRGQMALQKPGRFRWQHDTPHKQLIVSDGRQVFSFDPDLNQVVVKPLEQVVNGAPLALLSRETVDLTKDFLIGDLIVAEELHWYPLKARREGPITRLWLGFGGGELAGIEVEDNFRQRTRFRFAEVVRNSRLDPALFRFTPPAGADVVAAPDA